MKIVKIFSILSLILFTALLLTSCNKDVVKKKTLKENRKTWDAANTGNYEFNFAKICFCPYIGNARIVVKADTVFEVISSETGQVLVLNGDSIPALDRFPSQYLTIDQIFDYIEDERKSSYEVNAVFDEEYGYPTAVGVDKIKNAVDDEITYLVDSLVIQN